MKPKRRKLQKKNSDLEEEMAEKFETEQCPNPKPSIFGYKEQDQELGRLGKPVTRSKNIIKELSPRRQKMNTVFDELRETVENNEKITFIDSKNKKDFSVYNFSSGSDDESFKTKKYAFRKRINSTTFGSLNSRKLGQVNKNIPKMIDSGSHIVDRKRPRQKKAIKRQISKPNKSKVNSNILIDEKVRETTHDRLDDSLITEVSLMNVEENTEPTIEVPAMESLDTVKNNEKKSMVLVYPNKKCQSKKTKNIANKKKAVVEKQKVVSKENLEKNSDTDRTVSPLPSLLIEHEPTRQGDDTLSANAIQELKQKYRNRHVDVNNLLSDDLDINYSPHSNTNKQTKTKKRSVAQYNIEPYEVSDEMKQNTRRSTTNRNSVKNRISEHEILEAERYEDESLSGIDVNSKKSIPTVGNSPITAHGDMNEEPPNPKSLRQAISPRNLDTEYLDRSLTEYLNQLTKEINPLFETNYCNEEQEEIFLPEQNIHTEMLQNTNLNNSITKQRSKTFLPNATNSEASDAVEMTKIVFSPQIIEGYITSSSNSSEKKSSIKSKSQKSNNTNVSLSNKVNKNKVSRQCMISPIRVEDFTAEKQNNSKSDKRNDKDESPQRTTINNDRHNSRNFSTPVSMLRTSKKIGDWFTMNTNKKRNSCLQQKVSKKQKLSDDGNNTEEGTESDNETTVLVSNDNKQNVASGHSYEHMMFKETIGVVTEKLDTTLIQINENTGKRFVDMCKDLQIKIEKANEDRKKMYNDTARGLKNEINNLIRDKLEILHQRSQEMDKKWNEDFKQNTIKVLQDDIKQKNRMISLLKGDLQAMSDRFERGKQK